jgi:hypothetical protein
MSLATAAPTDLEAVKASIRSMLDYHRQEAQRLETALSVLEQTFPLSEAGVTPGGGQNGSVQATEAQDLVLNQADAELLPEPAAPPATTKRESRKAKPAASTSEAEPVEQKPSEVAIPKAAAPKGESFSLVNRLRATYQKYDGLNTAIAAALSKFDGAVEAPDLVDELYGRNLRKAFQPRAIGALTRQLNKGAKEGLWQVIEGEAGEAPAFAALD